MLNKEYIINKIIATYLEHLDEFQPGKARHFVYRAYKATKREDLKDLLENKYKTFTAENTSRVLDKYSNSYQELLEENKVHLSEYKTKKINDEMKLKEWLSHIDLYTYHSLIWNLYYIIALEINSHPNISIINKESITSELLSQPDFIKYATVSSVNIVYLSKNIGIFDIEEEFIKLFRQVFSEEEIMEDDVIFTNYIYGLTHIIIGESNFYTREIDKDKYSWVKKEFDKYSEGILKRLTLDVNTEVSICYKFLGVNKSEYIDRVTKKLFDSFNDSDGYIHRGPSEDNVKFAEHLNAISLVLLNFENILS